MLIFFLYEVRIPSEMRSSLRYMNLVVRSVRIDVYDLLLETYVCEWVSIQEEAVVQEKCYLDLLFLQKENIDLFAKRVAN